MVVTGKRHDFVVDYEVGFDDDGRIQGLDMTFAARCGWSSDLSGPVTDRALFHADNCYWLPGGRAALAAAQDQHRSPTPPFAASAARRAWSAASGCWRRSPTRSGATRWRSRKRNFYGDRRAQRHALPPDASRTMSSTSSWRELETQRRLRRAARGDPRLQRREPGAQARAGADPGQVRHLVHR